MEYTLPGVSQSVIITRTEGKTPVPEKESIRALAEHQATMVVFLSAGLIGELSKGLVEGGYSAETPAAIVYRATWPDEKVMRCTVGTLVQTAEQNEITKTSLIIVGEAVRQGGYERSKLYDPTFTTGWREVSDSKEQDLI